jgi:hypothetical protein
LYSYSTFYIIAVIEQVFKEFIEDVLFIFLLTVRDYLGPKTSLLHLICKIISTLIWSIINAVNSNKTLKALKKSNRGGKKEIRSELF